ncbi:hypothetical protein [Nitrospirillum amazonense]|uniref:hypothetical protein n=1 Tax=Nitrospirillum amazonense TaxID=28077 RepID=UPI00241251D8|nr:hypothetical protein [Nitrospirillum amazonense]MDG3442445.1 hypothetical protein [Nitrospirillum amazonense]
MINTGWTYRDVLTLTVPRYLALVERWKVYPPVPQLIACYFGFGKEQAAKEASLADLMAAFGDGTIR